MGLDAETERIWEEFQVEVPRWMMQSTEYIVELRSIADAIADYHTDAAIANNAGIATQVMGVVTGIVGIVAAPFTSGTSLILTGLPSCEHPWLSTSLLWSAREVTTSKMLQFFSSWVFFYSWTLFTGMKKTSRVTGCPEYLPLALRSATRHPQTPTDPLRTFSKFESEENSVNSWITSYSGTGALQTILHYTLQLQFLFLMLKYIYSQHPFQLSKPPSTKMLCKMFLFKPKVCCLHQTDPKVLASRKQTAPHKTCHSSMVAQQ